MFIAIWDFISASLGFSCVGHDNDVPTKVVPEIKEHGAVAKNRFPGCKQASSLARLSKPFNVEVTLKVCSHVMPVITSHLIGKL